MKRTAIVIITLGIFILAIRDCYVVKVQAQDYYDRYKPTMTPPSILVTSPQNHSIISTNSISLAFNVSGVRVIEVSPDINRHSSRLFKVSYKGDWQTEEQLLYSAEHESLDFLEFNTTLSGIPEGTHELQIIAVGEVGVIVAMFGFSYHSDANSSIIFTVNSIQPTPSPEPTPESNPFQTTLVIACVITVAILSIGLLVYFKKRTKSSDL